MLTLMLEGPTVLGANVHMNSTLILFREITMGAHKFSSRSAKVLENHGDFFRSVARSISIFLLVDPFRGPVELEKNERRAPIKTKVSAGKLPK
jgi:hypothetical protein